MKKRVVTGCLLLFCWALGTVSAPWALSSDLKTFQFPEVAGWSQSGEVEVYSPETLFEYIDGGADIYLKYDFEELKVAEYQNDKKGSVTVKIYRHKTPHHAFGIYSQERLASADFLQVGTEGYRDKEILNFLTGPYYVKISSFKIEPEDQAVLLTFARKVAEDLGEKGSLPSILSSFPKEGLKEKSQTFIAKNFLGYPFLHSSFMSDYETSGRKFKLFVIENEGRNESRDMVQKYLRQLGKPGEEVSEGRHTLSDPHHGEVDLFWKGRYVWGIVDLADASLRTRYLKLFEDEIQKRE